MGGATWGGKILHELNGEQFGSAMLSLPRFIFDVPRRPGPQRIACPPRSGDPNWTRHWQSTHRGDVEGWTPFTQGLSCESWEPVQGVVIPCG